MGLLQKDPKLTIVSPAGQRLIYLSLDTEREPTPFARDTSGAPLAKNPLKELKVRQALSMAINRNGIKSQIMDGFAAPAGQLLPEGAVGYTPDLKPDPYDPAKAKALLAEAGYPQGFQLTLHGPNDRYVNDSQIVEAIAQMWTRIGVKTAVETKPASMFFSEIARDLYTISLQGWASDTGEASSSLIQICASSNPEKGRGAVFKASHFARADIDAVIEESLATFDAAKREALYVRAEKMTAAEEGFIPLHHQVNIWAMKKHYALRPRQQGGGCGRTRWTTTRTLEPLFSRPLPWERTGEGWSQASRSASATYGLVRRSAPMVLGRAVAAEELHVVGQRHELVADGAEQRLGVAVGLEIGAADRALEQHVADKGEAAVVVDEDDVPGRVAGAMQNVETVRAEGDGVALV